MHCWVCDQEARQLANDERSAIVEYMTVETGSNENSDKSIKNSFQQPFHPLITRAYNLLEPYFEKHIVCETGQGLLFRKDKYVKLLNSLPDEQIRRELYESWEKSASTNSNSVGKYRWNQLKAATTPPVNNSFNPQKKRVKHNYGELEQWRYELIFSHCYPRLDANVSKARLVHSGQNF